MVVTTSIPEKIIKRDGRIVYFDADKIMRAIEKCLASVYELPINGIDTKSLNEITGVALNLITVRSQGTYPTVEELQDCVEIALQSCGEFIAAKHYILYRAEHTRNRLSVPQDIKDLFESDSKYFPTPIQYFQFLDKYSRFNYDLGRRETWTETVTRTVDYLNEVATSNSVRCIPLDEIERIQNNILKMDVMPSMRLMAMAGPAARRDNTSIYNCSYMPVDSIDSFVDALVIGMSGCGVGYSVESENVRQLPIIKEQINILPFSFVIDDSTEGWARAFRFGLRKWFAGEDVEFDYSKIRPAGTPLRTKGGTASGPKPLEELFEFARTLIFRRQGKQLSTLDAHDLMCKTGATVIAGGVRRTAMISIFDQDDMNMRLCKDGDFETDHSERWSANNSAVITGPLNQLEFMDMFYDMIKGGRGEPGIFNRRAALSMIPTRRQALEYTDYGLNPCGEIILRKRQFCNLTDIIVKPDDTIYTLLEKAEVAAIIGTVQSMATYFPLLSEEWKNNCDEERLLGVGLCGQMDNMSALTSANLIAMKQHVIETNKKWAAYFGINQSTATTCVKPNGNSSQLTNASSGLHARWAPYYLRRVRVGANTPMARLFQHEGVQLVPENKDDPTNPRTWVATFPIKSPYGAITRNDRSAVEQCNWWLHNKLYWTEHNPSITVTYKPSEVLDLTKWVYDNLDRIGGMAFLPESNAKYDQPPYEEITEEQYYEALKAFPPEIRWYLIYAFDDNKDHTTVAQEVACLAGICEM